MTAYNWLARSSDQPSPVAHATGSASTTHMAHDESIAVVNIPPSTAPAPSAGAAGMLAMLAADATGHSFLRDAMGTDRRGLKALASPNQPSGSANGGCFFIGP